jgi:signal transduction histidine kinase
VVIGRSEDCEVTIAGALVSRRHARILPGQDGWLIEDLGSANGTAVNGQQVESVRLQDGDWLTVGDCQLTFVLDEDYEVPSVAGLMDDAMPTLVDMVDVGRPPAAETAVPGSVRKLQAHLAVVKEVSEATCGSLEIGGLIERTLGLLLRVYPQAGHAHAVLSGFAGAGEDLRVSAARAGGTGGVGMSRTLLEIATNERKAVLAGDVAADQRLIDAQSIVEQRLRSMMCSPLVMGARTLGAIQVDSSDSSRPFTRDDLELLVAIAGQLAVSAENARLHGEMAAQQRLAGIGQAVSSVAHCIKNTLNGLQGGAYILDMGVKKSDAERTAKGWEMVKRNADFLGELVRDMLSYCRKSPPQRAATDMAALLAETAQMVKETASQAGVQVTTGASGEGVTAEVDATAIKRVVLNLLTNAVEACSQGRRVEVLGAPDEAGHFYRITVQDNGPGMPPHVREHLFEPFFSTKGSRGTGLGLALVQKVVQDHNGRVEVQSQEGEGTRFEILLPLKAGTTVVS